MTVACFGLAFKPDIDDLRESPSDEIAQHLAEHHTGKVLAVEPNITALRKPERFSLATQEQADEQADVAVLLVDHKVFCQWKPKTQFFVDTKGIW